VPRRRSGCIPRQKRPLNSLRAAVRFLRIAAFLPFAAAPLFGWGCEGHQAIALLARAHLSNAASEAVDRLFAENPIDPALSRFCKDRPADLMADASTWADDARNVEKTGEWHYIDIPLSVTHEQTDLSPWCAPIGPPDSAKDRTGCIVNAISWEWGILRDPSRTAPERAKALRYVIHFIGDLHQPLHDTDNDDRGGNCTAIRFFSEERPANLHAIWDYKLIQHVLERDRETQPQFASALDQKFAQHWTEWGQPKADVVAWTWEGHALAHDAAYGDLSPRISIEAPRALAPPNAAPDNSGTARSAAFGGDHLRVSPKEELDCNAERRKVAALHISVDSTYFDETEPLIERQLAKAGYRLAALLNQTFGQ
jgi:hypothetical protein